ncbi:MAG TPA: hypothetical protein VFF06_07405 [Polyangia bacterium]|nr:hypothetical protein [Polyangia bacterium]
MSRVARSCALVASLVSGMAFGQEPDECTTTTTTTVKCTGAAAPLAVPAPDPVAQPVAAPPPIYVQPPPQQPVLILPPLEGNWRFVMEPGGQLWRERVTRKRMGGLWGGGLGLWLSTYLIGVVAMPLNPFGWIPVFGAFTTAAFLGGGTATALFALDGVLQLGGWVMFIVGLSHSREKVERERVTVGPMLLPSGGGVGISGRF